MREVSNTIFFVWIEYEKILKYCSLCCFIRHDSGGCKRNIIDNMNSTLFELDTRCPNKFKVAGQNSSNKDNVVAGEHNKEDQLINMKQASNKITQQPLGSIKEVCTGQNNEPDLTLGEDTRTPTPTGTRLWHLNKKYFRKEELDKIATKIIANEVIKLINEAYEAVFEG